MPMTSRFTLFLPGVLLCMGLVMVACAAEADPEAAAIQAPERVVAQEAAPTATGEQSSAAGERPPIINDLTPTASPELPSPTPLAAALPDLGPAPDFTNEVWLNSDGPLTLESLKGEVVLVEFWTFG